MLINLTDVFTSSGKERRESFIYKPDCFSYMGNDYRILDKSPAELKLTNIGTGKVLLEGKMKLAFEIPCDRCLALVREHLELSFEREVISPDVMNRSSESLEDETYLTGYEFDAEAYVNSEILVNMPVKVLCKPDCKGICKKCGHNLNEGDCGCDTFVPDPRMAAIKDIFNANKEV